MMYIDNKSYYNFRENLAQISKIVSLKKLNKTISCICTTIFINHNFKILNNVKQILQYNI